MKRPVDLRSDTVTRPTPEMRRAIYEAEVGDDVFGDDPTVQALEQRVAGLLGKPAALFVPSGTMANQLAIRAQTHSGQEVIVEEYSHIFTAEAGAAAALSGVQLKTLASDRGSLDPGHVVRSILPDTNEHFAPTTLVCVENTHNRHGGRVYPQDQLDALAADVHARGLRLHLDGARLWNAAIASGRPLDQLAACADSVSVCFSKGLGAPVGSALVGSTELIAAARRWRKRFGGGMRQVGPRRGALHALEHHRGRLADDHQRIRRLLELAELPADVRLPGGPPETNILVLELPARLDPAAVLARLHEQQVWLVPFGPGLIRAITHLDIDDEQIDHAGRCLRQALAAPVQTR
jgi:threonine aldolase